MRGRCRTTPTSTSRASPRRCANGATRSSCSRRPLGRRAPRRSPSSPDRRARRCRRRLARRARHAALGGRDPGRGPRERRHGAAPRRLRRRARVRPGRSRAAYVALLEAQTTTAATFVDPERLGFPPRRNQRDRLLARIDRLLATSDEVAEKAAARFPGAYTVVPSGCRPRALRARPEQGEGHRDRDLGRRPPDRARCASGAPQPRRLGGDPAPHCEARRATVDPARVARPRPPPDGGAQRRAGGAAPGRGDRRPLAGRPRPAPRGGRGGRLRRRRAARRGGAAGARGRRAPALRRGRRGAATGRRRAPRRGRAGRASTSGERPRARSTPRRAGAGARRAATRRSRSPTANGS